mgnify:CR=1 FL=1
MDIPTPNAAALEITEFLLPYIGMVMIPEMVKQVLIRKDISSTEKINYKGGPFPESYPLTWQ